MSYINSHYDHYKDEFLLIMFTNYVYTYILALANTVRDTLLTLKDGVPIQKYPVKELTALMISRELAIYLLYSQ